VFKYRHHFVAMLAAATPLEDEVNRWKERIYRTLRDKQQFDEVSITHHVTRSMSNLTL